MLHSVRVPILRVPASATTTTGLLIDLDEAAGAAGLTAVALARHRWMARIRQAAAAAVEPLRRLHSGQ